MGHKSFLFILIIIGVTNYASTQVNSVMSYNIRYDNPNDSINKWDNRKAELARMIKHYKPELIGIQEGLEHQLIFLDGQLSNYARIGVGRDDGKAKGEFSPIYYDSTLYSLVTSSTFWLSSQPDQISVGWDASMERICTYGIFENKKSLKQVLVLNAHYDHIGPIARAESSKLILSRITENNPSNFPIILMGDFNAEADSDPITILTSSLIDGSEQSDDGIYGPIGTFTGFRQNEIATKRIDYIFFKNLEAKSYRHIDDKMKNNNYLSDHLPVLIEFH